MAAVLSIFVMVSIMAGCTATTRDLDPYLEPETDKKLHYDETYDFSDKKIIVNKLTASLIDETKKNPKFDNKPVLIVYNVANRTSEHINTSLITDDIRQNLINDKRFRFLNETQRENIQKELDFQKGGAMDEATRIQHGRQVGADFILSGTLYSIEKEEPRQVRVKRKSYRYYKLHLQLTDLETGLIEWTDSVEIARESAKPIIGW